MSKPKTKFLGAIVEGLSDSDEEKFMALLHDIAGKMAGVTVSGSVGPYRGEKVAKKSREDDRHKGGWYQAMKDGEELRKPTMAERSVRNKDRSLKGRTGVILLETKKSAHTILEEAAPKEEIGKKKSKKKVRVLSEDERKTINW